jgi:formylglycine-generating enzyme required for sulfatase activity
MIAIMSAFFYKIAPDSWIFSPNLLLQVSYMMNFQKILTVSNVSILIIPLASLVSCGKISNPFEGSKSKRKDASTTLIANDPNSSSVENSSSNPNSNPRNPVQPVLDTEPHRPEPVPMPEWNRGAELLYQVPAPMAFVTIQAGSFVMGTPDDEFGRWDGEGPLHPVTISVGFEMQMTEVTQHQWAKVMKSNPSHLALEQDCPNDFLTDSSGIKMCANHPVENITFSQALAFISRLNAQDQKYVYSLPTEAQWEFAARSETTTPYAGAVDDLAWHKNNSNDKTTVIAAKKPNPWGLYDMHGNVSEWTLDKYESYNAGPVVDPRNRDIGLDEVFRGGSFVDEPEHCRSGFRASAPTPNYRDATIGLRLMRKAR